ncbi:hypothetical protein M5K25_001540 [Dendrobium thyrsiflorum]|uniref:DUF4283 domain-containing protein n=1 Tax=Dendrobium thyrsiflorum TaxID=117978 RepID=A0ABD0VR70_DENTH
MLRPLQGASWADLMSEEESGSSSGDGTSASSLSPLEEQSTQLRRCPSLAPPSSPRFHSPSALVEVTVPLPGFSLPDKDMEGCSSSEESSNSSDEIMDIMDGCSTIPRSHPMVSLAAAAPISVSGSRSAQSTESATEPDSLVRPPACQPDERNSMAVTSGPHRSPQHGSPPPSVPSILTSDGTGPLLGTLPFPSSCLGPPPAPVSFLTVSHSASPFPLPTPPLPPVLPSPFGISDMAAVPPCAEASLPPISFPLPELVRLLVLLLPRDPPLCRPESALPLDDFTDTDGISLIPEMDAIISNAAKLDRALVAQFVGRRVPISHLMTELRRLWGHFGEFQVITMAPSSFLCLFHNAEARDAVLQRGPWIISASLLGMVRWSPNYVPNSLSGLHASIWIRLPQLPLLYWDIDNLTRMANFVSEPLWLDAHTSTWGRSSYARMCVRLDLSKPLIPGILIKGVNGHFFFQKIEYEGLSNFCFACGMVGPTVESCPLNWKNPSSPADEPSPTPRQPVVPPARTSPAPASPPPPTGLGSPPPPPPISPYVPPVPVATNVASGGSAGLGEWNIVKRKPRPRPKNKPPKRTNPPVPPQSRSSFPEGRRTPASSMAGRSAGFFKPLQRRNPSPILNRELAQLGPISASSPIIEWILCMVSFGDVLIVAKVHVCAVLGSLGLNSDFVQFVVEVD